MWGYCMGGAIGFDLRIFRYSQWASSGVAARRARRRGGRGEAGAAMWQRGHSNTPPRGNISRQAIYSWYYVIFGDAIWIGQFSGPMRS